MYIMTIVYYISSMNTLIEFETDIKRLKRIWTQDISAEYRLREGVNKKSLLVSDMSANGEGGGSIP